jgi:hypothetical protein
MMLRDSPLIQVIKTAAAIYTKNRTVLSAGAFFVPDRAAAAYQLFLDNKIRVRAPDLNK